MDIRRERPRDAAAVEALLTDAFGPERFAKTAYRLRDGVPPLGDLSLVAEDEDGVCGTVQLRLEQPDNQPHRADLAKMLVHRRARRRGLGAALMDAALDLARDCGKSLLVLDTVTGSDAERLYTRLGWQRVGVIPGYALWPKGGLCDTTVFYRVLAD